MMIRKGLPKAVALALAGVLLVGPTPLTEASAWMEPLPYIPLQAAAFERRLGPEYSLLFSPTFLRLNRLSAQWTAPSPAPAVEPASPYRERIERAGLLDPVSDPAPVATTPEEAFAIARSFRYVRDGSRDYWQSPQETEARRTGDCEDKAIWLFDRLRQSGYENLLLVVGKKSPRDRGLHVWVEYTDSDGAQRLLDPTAARKIWNVRDFGPSVYKRIYSFDGTNCLYHSSR